MIKIREFRKEDLCNGYIETISEAWPCDSITQETLTKVLDQNCYVFVAEVDGEIVGSVNLYIQNKFIHNGSAVGFIEEVVTRQKYMRQNIGSMLVKKASQKCEEIGCYKVILCCSDELVSFYEKSGFKTYKQNIMRKKIVSNYKYINKNSGK